MPLTLTPRQKSEWTKSKKKKKRKVHVTAETRKVATQMSEILHISGRHCTDRAKQEAATKGCYGLYIPVAPN